MLGFVVVRVPDACDLQLQLAWCLITDSLCVPPTCWVVSVDTGAPVLHLLIDLGYQNLSSPLSCLLG